MIFLALAKGRVKLFHAHLRGEGGYIFLNFLLQKSIPRNPMFVYVKIIFIWDLIVHLYILYYKIF